MRRIPTYTYQGDLLGRLREEGCTMDYKESYWYSIATVGDCRMGLVLRERKKVNWECVPLTEGAERLLEGMTDGEFSLK